LRLLLVDDDRGLLELIRATFDEVDAEITAVESTEAARRAVAQNPPDVIVLDIILRGESGLDLCRELKARPETAGIPIVLLSGSIEFLPRQVAEAGADAFLSKPFSPLQLVALVERLASGAGSISFVDVPSVGADNGQLLLYAKDLRRIVELERTQRRLLQEAYGATVGALAEALATKDTGTRAHSRRVQRYAVELMHAVEPALCDDVSIEYGFVLHDVGKIGISDHILQKPGQLNPEERRLIEQHPLLGYEMLRDVTFLQGEGLAVVRSHHERWDGRGYPDKLVGTEIPLPARIFAVADALDAMTSVRPYRPARPWREAGTEILAESGAQFDPRVVTAFKEIEPKLREVQRSLVAA
jgi:response regulator RpfG family c-di-GMP phosphodiesterase